MGGVAGWWPGTTVSGIATASQDGEEEDREVASQIQFRSEELFAFPNFYLQLPWTSLVHTPQSQSITPVGSGPSFISLAGSGTLLGPGHVHSTYDQWLLHV